MTVAISTTEQASVATEASDHQPPIDLARERSKRETRRALSASRRESVARYLADDGITSNYEAMCAFIAQDPQGPEPCPDCHGNGTLKLARHVIEQLDQKLEHQLDELESLERLHAAYSAEAHKPRDLTDEIEERLRQEAVKDADRTRKKIIDLHEAMRKDRDRRKKRERCLACAGTGRGPRHRDGEPGKPDSFYSTVTCPGCRGCDDRNERRAPDGGPRYPKLLTRHYGSSTGERRLRGSTVEHDPNDPPEVYTVVSNPRDDAAAERHDQCGTCSKDTPDGMGTGYVVPITVRPSLKTASDAEEERSEEDKEEAEGRCESDYDAAPLDPRDPADFLELAQKKDPLLAAAIAAYVGPEGDTYAGHTWGRRFALWPLTEAGRCLADESRATSTKRAPYERLLELCAVEHAEAVQADRVDPRRSSLVRRADADARALERRVLQEFDAA